MPYKNDVDVKVQTVLSKTFYNGVEQNPTANSSSNAAVLKQFVTSGSARNTSQRYAYISKHDTSVWVRRAKRGPVIGARVETLPPGEYVDRNGRRFYRKKEKTRIIPVYGYTYRYFLKKGKKRRVPAPSLLPNSLSAVHDEISCSSDDVVLTARSNAVPAYTRTISGQLPMFGGYKPRWLSSTLPYHTSWSPSAIMDNVVLDLDRQALSEVHVRVKNQSVNAAQFLAEFKQTRSMISDAAMRLAKTLLALKKGNVGKAAKTLFPTSSKQLANDHLVIQYGVRPLLSDIDGMAKFLADRNESDYFDIIVVRSRKGTFSDSKSDNYGWAWKQNIICNWETVVKYKLRLRTTLGTTRAAAQLGFGNPLILAWELVPYSFIIDKIIDIGRYLEELDSFAGIEVMWAHKTVIKKYSFQVFTTIGGTDHNGYKWDNAVFSGSRKRTEVNRSLIANPSTTFKARPPDFAEKVPKMLFVANLLALLRQGRK